MSELLNNTKEKRQTILKGLIKDLHDGKDPELVKKAFKEHFESVSTQEISEMEQALIKEGLPIEEVQRLCDVHASIFGGSVSDIHKDDLSETPGHPLNVLKTENQRIETVIEAEIYPYLEQVGNTALLMLRVGFDRLQEIDKHYTRKEQLFFPYLEKKGITGPPQVMWGVDDEIRREMKSVRTRLDDPTIQVEAIKEAVLAITKKIVDMVFKENTILIPLLADTLNLYNFIKIAEASDEIGYFLEKPAVMWHVESTDSETEDVKTNTAEVVFDAGALPQAVVNAMLNTLPLDLTFVDADGHVRYFTQGKERIFDRPKTILGRHVNMCHPPASVHIVEKIVEAFRTGEKDHEDFWIELRGQFLHIRYFAVRDAEGTFLGTLEMTQNVAPIRALEGEKRLMDE